MLRLEKQKVARVLDANFNRAKEGLRVCEDITRFVFNFKAETRKYKDIRHALENIRSLLEKKFYKGAGARNIIGDVGKISIAKEGQRKSINDIFYANAQRIKESIRVLEEFLKLADTKAAQECKRIRYQVYELERKTTAKILRG